MSKNRTEDTVGERKKENWGAYKGVQSPGNIFWITSTRAYLTRSPNLSFSRVHTSLKVFKRTSNEAAGTNKPGHLCVNEQKRRSARKGDDSSIAHPPPPFFLSEIALDTSSQRNTICIINSREPLVTQRFRYNHVRRSDYILSAIYSLSQMGCELFSTASLELIIRF